MPFKIVPHRDRKLHGLFGRGEMLVLARGEVVYEAGAPAGRVFLVEDGHIRLTFAHRRRERERTAAVVGPGELFGTEALVSRSTRVHGGRSGEPARLRAVEGEKVFRALRGSRTSLAPFLQAASRDLFRARWSSAGGSGPSAGARVADLLLELADRWGASQTEEIRIAHRLTHLELADLAGTHRSTVTTLLNEWIYDGLLSVDGGGIVVVRPADLAARGSGREGEGGSR